METAQFQLDPALAESDVLMDSPVHGHAPQAHDGDGDEDEGMDLFGDDTGVETRERRRTPGTASNKDSEADAEGDPEGDGLTNSQREQRKHMEYEEDEEGEPVVVQLREAAVSIPNLPMPKSSNGEHWVIRMTNFAKLDSKPFDPETYTGPEYHDEDDQETLKERSLSIKLEVENTVRWRWVKTPEGTLRRQSNSRIVRWSDGSMSLQLGKEFFDVNANVDTSASLSRTSIHASGSQQSQQSQQTQSAAAQQGLTYLVAQHKRAEILQAEAIITGSLTLRPAGMQSETHRKLVRAVGQKHHKVARLKLSEDPSKDLEREANERMKNAFKNKKTKREKGETPIRRRPSSGGFSRSGTKRRRGEDLYSDDDDEPEGEYTDEEYGRSKGSGGDRKGADYLRDDFLLSDDDDIEEDDERRSKKKSKHNADEDDIGQDLLDEMEEKMEKARTKKKATSSTSKPKSQSTAEDADSDKPEDEVPEPMQLESEEEDEDAPVRTASSRKKKAVVEDEDEDD